MTEFEMFETFRFKSFAVDFKFRNSNFKLDVRGGDLMNLKVLSLPLFLLSLVPLILSAYGAFAGVDIWLASTQWLLVALVLGVYSVFTRIG